MRSSLDSRLETKQNANKCVNVNKTHHISVGLSDSLGGAGNHWKEGDGSDQEMGFSVPE